MTGRIRLADVAKAAEVSVATASKALTGAGRMTAETRERVQRVASELGFRPNAMARALIQQRSFTIGLLTGDSYGRFSMPVMQGISEALVHMGISVFMCGIEDDPGLAQVHLNAMLEKQVDGIICTGKRIDRQLPLSMEGVPIPVVYALAAAPEGSVVLVADDAQGATDATKWLKGLGRRNIAHVTGPESFASARLRAEAFRAVTGGTGEVLHGAWSEGWGHQAVARLWEGNVRPDGIFCGNDQIARGVVDALRERGVRVPEDVSVVGFDNWEIVAAATRPPLTTVDMNLRELGREAGRLVMALAGGSRVEPGARALPCSLVVRGSCGGGPAAAKQGA
ncbi:MAG: LacI family DNA-binding transcriptional regulator [Exiguobacterium profundum]|nr:MAG: LacI family DNA-binding transcriptional regulator [Exiguobacterium profundum]